jgi:hypothetical protein
MFKEVLSRAPEVIKRQISWYIVSGLFRRPKCVTKLTLLIRVSLGALKHPSKQHLYHPISLESSSTYRAMYQLETLESSVGSCNLMTSGARLRNLKTKRNA